MSIFQEAELFNSFIHRNFANPEKYIYIDFMLFTGFELNSDTPDASTICRFRNKLAEKNLDEKLFSEINKQLEKAGLKLVKAKGAVIDASIIKSAARPRKVVLRNK